MRKDNSEAGGRLNGGMKQRRTYLDWTIRLWREREIMFGRFVLLKGLHARLPNVRSAFYSVREGMPRVGLGTFVIKKVNEVSIKCVLEVRLE